MRMQVHESLDDIDAREWNALVGDYPFLRHEFLAALEHSTGMRAVDTNQVPTVVRYDF